MARSKKPYRALTERITVRLSAGTVYRLRLLAHHMRRSRRDDDIDISWLLRRGLEEAFNLKTGNL